MRKNSHRSAQATFRQHGVAVDLRLVALFLNKKFAPIRNHNDINWVRRVLDVGCRPGTNSRFFKQATTSTSISIPPLLTARRKSHPHTSRRTFARIRHRLTSFTISCTQQPAAPPRRRQRGSHSARHWPGIGQTTPTGRSSTGSCLTSRQSRGIGRSTTGGLSAPLGTSERKSSGGRSTRWSWKRFLSAWPGCGRRSTSTASPNVQRPAQTAGRTSSDGVYRVAGRARFFRGYFFRRSPRRAPADSGYPAWFGPG